MKKADFEQEIMRLQPTLKAFTHRFTSDRESSEDLVQDTVLRALQFRDKYRSHTNLTGWLFTIMRNTYINKYRKSQRTTFRDIHGDMKFKILEDTHTFNRPSAVVEYKEVWKYVNELREDLRMPLKMHLTGYKYEEIVQRLMIPIGTVKNRIFHARQEVQKKLEGYR